jgi:uncharacterized membrane protein YbhN (UPF0104 family)
MMTDSQGESRTDGGYPVPSGGRSVLKPLLRTAVGVGIIALLVVRSDLDAIGDALADANPVSIGLAFVLMMALLAVSALRWAVFLRSLGVELSVGPTMRLTFVGAFFNAFLPTGIGGDAYKAMRVRATGVPLSKTLASVMLDRIVGIVSLAAIGLAAGVTRLLAGDSGPVVPIAALASLGILAAAGLLIGFGEKFVGSGRVTWFGLRARLQRTARALTEAGTHPHSVRWGIAGGLSAQVLGIAAHVALARALALSVSLSALILGVVVATVAATAPITINGLGVREGVWVWVLGVYGVGGSESLAYALLVLAMSLGSSAVGGLVYAVAGGGVRPATTRARS